MAIQLIDQEHGVHLQRPGVHRRCPAGYLPLNHNVRRDSQRLGGDPLGAEQEAVEAEEPSTANTPGPRGIGLPGTPAAAHYRQRKIDSMMITPTATLGNKTHGRRRRQDSCGRSQGHLEARSGIVPPTRAVVINARECAKCSSLEQRAAKSEEFRNWSNP